jgi:hypothetical protein
MATVKKLSTQARQNKLDNAVIAIDPITVTFVNDKGKHEVASRQKKKAKQNTTAIADQVKANAKKEGEKLAKELADQSAKHDQKTVTKHDPEILPQNEKGIVKIANKDPDPVSTRPCRTGRMASTIH